LSVPKSSSNLAGIAAHDVGEAKLRQYGAIFLDAIRQHAVDSP